MKKEPMNLNKSKEGCMGGFRGRKGEKCNYIILKILK